jgi:hypothetical protein
MNDRDLMSIRADTLFTYNAQGRMLCSNEPNGYDAPRVFLGCTKSGYVLRFGEKIPEDVANQIEQITQQKSPINEPQIPLDILIAVREVLSQHAPIRCEGGGPTYRFPSSGLPKSEAIQLSCDNIDIVSETYPWLFNELDDCQPCFAIVREAKAVSVCFSSRVGVYAREAGLETLASERRQGYAASVTSAWGASLQAAGIIPLYSTSWENLASQAVARHLGLIRFGADVTLT